MMSKKSVGSRKRQKSPINRGLAFVVLAVMALSAVFILYTTTSQQDVRGFASEQATAESVTYHCLGNESCVPTSASGGYACPEDMRKCSDGRWVGRSGPKCEFNCGAISVTPLPKTTCTPRPRCLDANPACLPPIPPGGWCGDPITKTTVMPLPSGVRCTEDMRKCPDGRWVGRSGPKCEFNCGAISITPLPRLTCIPRPRCLDGNPRCMIAEPREGWCPRPSVTRKPLPSSIACPQDIKMCPDGSGVGRVAPKCEFATCPSVRPNPSVMPCPQDIKMCPDGSGVGRIAPKCEFAACPGQKIPQTKSNSSGFDFFNIIENLQNLFLK